MTVGGLKCQSNRLFSAIGWLFSVGGISALVDVVVVSGGEITLSVVRFGILCFVPLIKMQKS